MREHMTTEHGTSLAQKIALVFLAFILFAGALEMSLRLGGFVLSSMQEHRNQVAIQKKGDYRILCLGESTTAGGQESYPNQLQEVLNNGKRPVTFAVINKGVPAINTFGILSQLEDNIEKYKPDMVIVMMGINDSGRHMPQEDEPQKNETSFLNSLKVYRMSRFLWLRILNKLKEEKLFVAQDKAYAQMQNVPVADLSDAKACLDAGRKCSERGDYSCAEELFNKALKADPDNDGAYLLLGWCYKEQGRYPESEAAFKKALEFNSSNDSAYSGLGWLYLDKHELEKAEGLLKESMRINQKNYLAYALLGRVYRDQGKLIEAEEVLSKVIALDPGNTQAFFELLGIYVIQNRYSDAQALFSKITPFETEGYRLYAGMAFLQERVGKNKLIEGYLERLKKLQFEYYCDVTKKNYLELYRVLQEKRIKLVCVQYPMRNVEPLKRIFIEQDGIIFVDNERVFKDAVSRGSPKEYFVDMFGGEFGHCTPKGNRLLAENVANAILNEYFWGSGH